MGGRLPNQAFGLLVAVNHLVENGYIGGLDLAGEFREIALKVGYTVFVALGPGTCIGLLQIDGGQFDTDHRGGPLVEEAMVKVARATADVEYAATFYALGPQRREQLLLVGLEPALLHLSLIMHKERAPIRVHLGALCKQCSLKSHDVLL
jgi:hypothetical protein